MEHGLTTNRDADHRFLFRNTAGLEAGFADALQATKEATAEAAGLEAVVDIAVVHGREGGKKGWKVGGADTAAVGLMPGCVCRLQRGLDVMGGAPIRSEDNLFQNGRPG